MNNIFLIFICYSSRTLLCWMMMPLSSTLMKLYFLWTNMTLYEMRNHSHSSSLSYSTDPYKDHNYCEEMRIVANTFHKTKVDQINANIYYKCMSLPVLLMAVHRGI